MDSFPFVERMPSMTLSSISEVFCLERPEDRCAVGLLVKVGTFKFALGHCRERPKCSGARKISALRAINKDTGLLPMRQRNCQIRPV
jgi:hypothetical protein